MVELLERRVKLDDQVAVTWRGGSGNNTDSGHTPEAAPQHVPLAMISQLPQCYKSILFHKVLKLRLKEYLRKRQLKNVITGATNGL